MPEMTIAVRGTASLSLPAQTATLRPIIHCDSDESAAAAAAAASSAANELSERLDALAERGVVDTWSVGGAHTWQSAQQYEIVTADEIESVAEVESAADDDGPGEIDDADRADDADDADEAGEYLVEYVEYTAEVRVDVRFVRLGADLDEFVTDLMSDSAVRVSHIAWGLHTEDEEAARTRIYALAVDNAVQKANAIAGAAGCADPVPTSIVEPGMSSPVPTYERPHAALGAPAPRAFTGDDQPPVLALRPEEQQLWAMVEATFTAVRP